MRPREDDREPGPVHGDRDHGVTVAYVGSRGLISVRLALHVARKISKLPKGSVVLVRRGRNTELGPFERVVEACAKSLGITYFECIPKGPGRESVYRRDYEMVEAADYVEAYFPESAVMDGGTGHVVDAALNREKTVYAWSVSEEGTVERIGEYERAPVDEPSPPW